VPAKRDSNGRFIKGSGGGGRVRERDNGLREMLRRFRGLSDWRVRVGVQGVQAQAPRGFGMTNGDLAVIHEFGAPKAGIPARPFVRPPLDTKEAHWRGRLASALEAAVKSGGDPKQALHVVGEELRAEMVDRVKAGIPPPLQEATIARKGEDTPLIDTGVLIGSISVVVDNKGST